MSRVDPSTSHKRLQNVKFLDGADLELFADLKNRVLGLLEPDDKIEIPGAAGADAWSRTFRIYQKLQMRRENQIASDAQAASQNAATEQAWNEFMRQRAIFAEWLQREPISSDMKAYIGLLPSDLETPVIENDPRFNGARVPDWRGRADRISSAMWKLKSMPVHERLRVPDIMQQRRLVDAVNELREQFKNFEQKFDWLDARISSVESKSIDRSNKH